MPPETFERQLRTLRRCGIRILTPEELGRFHRGKTRLPARRATVITIDDATPDVLEPIASIHDAHRQLFVVTAAAGGSGAWLDGTALAGWKDLRSLAALGVAIGAHTRSHPSDLAALADSDLESEVDGSRRDLAEAPRRANRAVRVSAGGFDARVRRLVAEAGFSLAYSTTPGLNGAGSDRYAPRRVSAKAWDSRLSIPLEGDRRGACSAALGTAARASLFRRPAVPPPAPQLRPARHPTAPAAQLRRSAADKEKTMDVTPKSDHGRPTQPSDSVASARKRRLENGLLLALVTAVEAAWVAVLVTGLVWLVVR
jgi:peptidoglycan/xylan/chitin deacetylase (PgdA/CDA1 family)